LPHCVFFPEAQYKKKLDIGIFTSINHTIRIKYADQPRDRHE
jgi:hypothetical protein